jgi:hypothetical protein
MKWLLYIVLAILAMNLLVIVMVGVVLLNDWIRNRKRPQATSPFSRGVPGGGRPPTPS